ncbi:hypothetical protein, partial [Streptomyces sp. NPDC002922]|uniref:hypothetical protein n=1 Tax=Streptomyces sp. NPDC002922 TaxID=3154439 RepID=UPI0033A824A3
MVVLGFEAPAPSLIFVGNLGLQAGRECDPWPKARSAGVLCVVSGASYVDRTDPKKGVGWMIRAYKFLMRPTTGQQIALGEMLRDHC